MPRMKGEMTVRDFGASCARSFAIAQAGISGKDITESGAENVYLPAWEVAVNSLLDIGEGEVTVSEAGRKAYAAYQSGVGMPEEWDRLTHADKVAWQAVACHVVGLLERGEQEDGPLSNLEISWAAWARDRANPN